MALGIPDIRVLLERLGRTTPMLNLSESVEGLNWSTSAIGGYADASFSLAGDRRRDVPFLSTLRVILQGTLVWEGLVEDVTLEIGAGGKARTSVQAFGLQRLLAWTTLRRTWQSKDISSMQPVDFATGGTFKQTPNFWNVNVGSFTTSAGTNSSGVYFHGVDGGAAIGTANLWNGVQLITPGPDGVVLVTLKYDWTKVALTATSGGTIQSAAGTGAWTTHISTLNATALAQSQALVASATRIRLGIQNTSAAAVVATDEGYFSNLQILGTTLTQDTVSSSGGYFGGTILKDLVALVPGITIGMIESGSDYTLQQIEASARRTVLDVVQEVAGYYSREWAVWEDGRFDWKTHDIDSPQWLLTLNDLQAGSSIESSVDGTAETVYVLYTEPSADAAPSAGSPSVPVNSELSDPSNPSANAPTAGASTQDAKEATAAASDRRNPFVTSTYSKDIVYSAQSLTTADAQQLATNLVTDQGSFPVSAGSIKVSLNRLLKQVNGSQKPAAFLRGGDTVVITNMPKTGDPFRVGRDGETYFHVVSTECDLKSQTLTATLEGQTRRSDVILARLAAATRP